MVSLATWHGHTGGSGGPPACWPWAKGDEGQSVWAARWGRPCRCCESDSQARLVLFTKGSEAMRSADPEVQTRVSDNSPFARFQPKLAGPSAARAARTHRPLATLPTGPRRTCCSPPRCWCSPCSSPGRAHRQPPHRPGRASLRRQRRLQQRDVRGVQVRAVEREAVGERLAVGREELVEEVEPVQAGRGLLGAAQRGVRVRVR